MSKTKKIDTSKYAHICIALTHNTLKVQQMKDAPPKLHPCVNPKF